MNSYILCVAGESSGDRIGESIVQSSTMRGWEVRGVGGPRMQKAGLASLVEYDGLAVNGYTDVLLRFSCLKRAYQKLRDALNQPECKALVCIDYPGFNMRLFRLARKLSKPVFWVAPPQIWAWKSRRGREFLNQEVHVLFPWEYDVYQKAGAHPVLVRHPLLDEIPNSKRTAVSPLLALLPGSRWPQAKRNGDSYVRLAQAHFPGSLVMIAPDDALAKHFRGRWGNQIEIRVANAERDVWGDVTHAICSPGTISLELVLRGIRTCVFARIDVLSYLLGLFFLRIPYFALPNIILGKLFLPEILVPALGKYKENLLEKTIQEPWVCLPGNSEEASARSIRNFLKGTPLSECFTTFLDRNFLDRSGNF